MQNLCDKNVMVSVVLLLLLVFTVGSCGRGEGEREGVDALVIHGGAGTILKEKMTPELEAAYRETLAEALREGYAVLDEGGSSLDAVVAAIRVLEDSELFNAGKGAVFTAEGKNELDASIMDGATGMAGAVGSVTTIKNPIVAARAVMERTRHVMLVGRGAEMFAAEQGLEIVGPEYFFTQRRWDQLLKKREKTRKESSLRDETDDHGTAGAIALDKRGNLAVGTSTGGLTNKMQGRVGDSPIIGAGTYVDNATCGVSGTGTGEFFMRGLIAYDVSVRMRYSALTVEDAAKAVIKESLTDKGGDGGIIALDKDGNVAMQFNTPGMYRGYIKADGEPQVFIFGDE